MTREQAIKELTELLPEEFLSEYADAIKMAIEALEKEPFINKPCVSENVCEHDKQMVLDKIRSEIQKLRNCSCSNSDGIIDDVEDILDKYKAEGSEE